MTSKARWAIVAAMEEEIRPLFGQLTNEAEQLRPSDALGRTALGRLHGQPVVLAVIGDGAIRARQGLLALLRQVPVDRLLVAGFAGGLSTDLALGDVRLTSLVRAARRPSLNPEPTSSIQSCPLWSADKLLINAGQKRKLFREAFDSSGSAMVDLETYSLAELAGARGIPWQGIRVVSDVATEDLPSSLARSVRPDGSLDRGRLAWQALQRPRELVSLWNLKHKAETCARKLSDACCCFVEEAPPAVKGPRPSFSGGYPAGPDPVDTPGGPQSVSRSDDHVRSRRLSADTDPDTKRRLEVL